MKIKRYLKEFIWSVTQSKNIILINVCRLHVYSVKWKKFLSKHNKWGGTVPKTTKAKHQISAEQQW